MSCRPRWCLVVRMRRVDSNGSFEFPVVLRIVVLSVHQKLCERWTSCYRRKRSRCHGCQHCNGRRIDGFRANRDGASYRSCPFPWPWESFCSSHPSRGSASSGIDPPQCHDGRQRYVQIPRKLQAPTGRRLPRQLRAHSHASCSPGGPGPGKCWDIMSKPRLNVYVKSIRLGDADVLNDGLHLDSQPRQELVIVLGANPGILEGRVINARRQPIPRATVVLIPEGGIRFRVDHKFTSTDASGRFRPSSSSLRATTKCSRGKRSRKAPGRIRISSGPTKAWKARSTSRRATDHQRRGRGIPPKP